MARLLVHVLVAVVENGEGAVGMAPGVVLVDSARTRAHLEVAVLAA